MGVHARFDRTEHLLDRCGNNSIRNDFASERLQMSNWALTELEVWYANIADLDYGPVASLMSRARDTEALRATVRGQQQEIDRLKAELSNLQTQNLEVSLACVDAVAFENTASFIRRTCQELNAHRAAVQSIRSVLETK